MLDEVCSKTKFHPKCFDAKVWIFRVGLVWWSFSSNIHKFSLISNVCTFALQFEFLNVFSNFEFRFNHKYLLWMRKVQDHVLEQRRTRYISYDRESLRKPSERKGYFKKGQRREGKGEQHCKKTKSKGGKDWMDEKISLLIDMVVEKSCLWDAFDKEYTKRDVK